MSLAFKATETFDIGENMKILAVIIILFSLGIISFASSEHKNPVKEIPVEYYDFEPIIILSKK